MSLSDLFSPIKRQIALFLILFLVISASVYAAFTSLPATQKTTIYFSLKPLQTELQSPTFDHAESTSKMAEAMSGWAKNPQFREDVAAEAGITIDNFKRKLSARKQNYINVFWTLKLTGKEIEGRDKVVAAIVNQVNQRFIELNNNSQAPYAMTTPEIFSEGYTLPAWAVIIASLLTGLGLSLAFVYVREGVSNKASFLAQVEALFPDSPLLNVPERLGSHDEKLLERFILTFESPRLVGTFPKSEKHFSLSPTDTIQASADTPVLLVKLGETTITELKNMKAIFGEGVGLIVFHQ